MKQLCLFFRHVECDGGLIVIRVSHVFWFAVVLWPNYVAMLNNRIVTLFNEASPSFLGFTNLLHTKIV